MMKIFLGESTKISQHQLQCSMRRFTRQPLRSTAEGEMEEQSSKENAKGRCEAEMIVVDTDNKEARSVRAKQSAVVGTKLNSNTFSNPKLSGARCKTNLERGHHNKICCLRLNQGCFDHQGNIKRQWNFAKL